MSAKKAPADTLTPGQIAMAFDQIASTADVIDCLTSALIADRFDSNDEAGAVLAATQRLSADFDTHMRFASRTADLSALMLLAIPTPWPWSL